MTLTDQAKVVLEERARLLAQPLAEQHSAGASDELFVFSRAGTTYAVEAPVVAEVIRLAEHTPLVSVPAAIVGVVNHRGRIVALVDVAALFPGAADTTADAGFGVVVHPQGAWFALCADGVYGITRLEDVDVHPATARDDASDGVVRGLTPDLTAILDVAALARDRRVEVDDEAE